MKVIIIETNNRTVDLHFRDEIFAKKTFEALRHSAHSDERELLDIDADGVSISVWNDELCSIELIDPAVQAISQGLSDEEANLAGMSTETMGQA